MNNEQLNNVLEDFVTLKFKADLVSATSRAEQLIEEGTSVEEAVEQAISELISGNKIDWPVSIEAKLELPSKNK